MDKTIPKLEILQSKRQQPKNADSSRKHDSKFEK